MSKNYFKSLAISYGYGVALSHQKFQISACFLGQLCETKFSWVTGKAMTYVLNRVKEKQEGTPDTFSRSIIHYDPLQTKLQIQNFKSVPF